MLRKEKRNAASHPDALVEDELGDRAHHQRGHENIKRREDADGDHLHAREREHSRVDQCCARRLIEPHIAIQGFSRQEFARANCPQQLIRIQQEFKTRVDDAQKKLNARRAKKRTHARFRGTDSVCGAAAVIVRRKSQPA